MIRQPARIVAARSLSNSTSMKLVIRDDVDALADYAAGEICDLVNAAKAAGRPCVLGLPAGRTVLKTYARLVARHKAGDVDFDHVIGFVLDESTAASAAARARTRRSFS